MSDYSEMADPLKEHLANVQILQSREMESTLYTNPFGVSQKVPRTSEETDEQYSKRLKKINYLSLAQEFAELKKIDADALPFNLHKEGQVALQDASPMSEASSEDSPGVLTGSAANTPDDGPSLDPIRGDLIENHLSEIERLTEDMKTLTSNVNESTDTPPGAKLQNQMEVQNLMNQNKGPNIKDSNKSSKDKESTKDNELKDSEDPVKDSNESKASLDSKESKNILSKESSSSNLKAVETGQPGKSPKSAVSPGSEKLEDFDVYNIESTLPQMDWAMLEAQLQKAAEEERKKREVGINLFAVQQL